MHPAKTVASVLALHAKGLNNCEIARRTGVSRPTIREWINGRLPHSYRPHNRRGDLPGRGVCEKCGGGAHSFGDLDANYVHLLGLYLGDGSIATHRRGVYRMRITLDVKYPGIVRDCRSSPNAGRIDS